MSRVKVIPTALPNKGLILNKPEEFLKNNFSTGESRNMEFYNELLQGRLGLDTLIDYELSGPIQLIDQFWEYSGSWHFLIATTKDIYKYNFAPGTGSSAYLDILTPLYTTGSICADGTGASTTLVVGSDPTTDFDGNGIKAGDFLKVGTASPLSTDTWYEIESVTAGTGSSAEIILTDSGPSVIDSQFTIRKCFSGSSTDFWQSRTFVDENLGDTWIVTNGVDFPQYWIGSGQMVTLGTDAGGFTAAKFIEVYKDRVILGYTVEGGNNSPQRVRWSGVANCAEWAEGDFKDFIDDGYWITGMGIMASSHIVFRERDAYIGRYVGGDYIFDWDKSSSCAGVWAPTSLVLFEREAYYYGPDNKFHHWNLLTDEIISESIFPRSKDYNPNLEQTIFGWQIEAKNQIRWFCPYSDTDYHNEVIVYDYAENIIQIWEYEQAQACCSIGEYLNTEDLYMDDSIWGEYYLDEMEGYFDDRFFLDAAPVTVYGGYDGYLRIADIGYTDDGTEYTRKFESIRDNYKLPQQNKRLWKQQFWLNSELSGEVSISVKKDDSNSYSPDTGSISLINANRDIIKENLTWNRTAENFKIKIEATNHFALLGWLNFIFPKGKTYQ